MSQHVLSAHSFLRRGEITLVRLAALGAFFGAFWGSGLGLVGLLGLPIIYRNLHCRRSVAALMLGYYLMAARGLPGGAAVFFGQEGGWLGWLFWAASSMILAAPFVWLHRWRGYGFVGALVLVALPPLGFVGWCNPLTVAGLLFPGAGIYGLILTMGCMFLLAHRLADRGWLSCQIQLLFAVLVFSSAVNLAYIGSQERAGEVDTSWLGIDTVFSALRSGVEVGGADIEGQVDALARLEWVQRFMETIPAGATAILPETVLGRFSPIAESFLSSSEQGLRARGAGIFIGAEMPQKDGRYVNAMIGIGYAEEPILLAQSVPVPVSMWKPFTGTGAAPDLLGDHGVRQVGDRRIGVLICYEQMLPWVMLLRGVAAPDLVLSVKNVWWARGTSIPAIQEQSVSLFARLFGWKVISATNT